MTNEKCKVLAHSDFGSGYRHLVFEAPEIVKSAKPGQFVHVRVPGLEASALRRPFSIFNAEDGRLEMLYKAIGRGTTALTALRVGDELSIMGPLGHGFPTKCSGVAMMVGGGFGVAPLYFLARLLQCEKKLFVGGRTANDLLALDRFAALGDVEVFTATNDGSAGMTGLVTAPLDIETAKLAESAARYELFACGPDPMLKAIATRATDAKVPGWISMDRHMICGVGACYACVQKTVRGYSRCCIEGPVFRAEDLVW